MCRRKTLKSYWGVKGNSERNIWYSSIVLCYLAYDWVDTVDYFPHEYSHGEKYASFVQSPILKYHIRLCRYNLRYCCQIFCSWSRMCSSGSLRNKRTLLCSIDYYTSCEHTFLYESLCYFLYKGGRMGSRVASIRRRRRWWLNNNKNNLHKKDYIYMFKMVHVFS